VDEILSGDALPKKFDLCREHASNAAELLGVTF